MTKSTKNRSKIINKMVQKMKKVQKLNEERFKVKRKRFKSKNKKFSK